jgi:dGTPase
VDHLERQYPSFPGLNLTYEVREAIAKHSTAYDCPDVREFGVGVPPTLEAQIVEAADSVAYDSHDIDDGLASNILSEPDLLRLRLPARAWRLAEPEFQRETGPGDRVDAGAKPRRRQLVRHLINLVVTDLIGATDARLRGLNLQSADDVRRMPGRVVCYSPELNEEKEELERYLLDNFYQHYRVQRMVQKAKRFLREIFSTYLRDPKQLPSEYQKRAEHEGLHQTVCDYIAGMTDRFAQAEYQRLFAPFEKA